MKSLLLLLSLLYLLPVAEAFRFVSKVEELPVEVTDRLEIIRPKVRLCGGDSEEESNDCVLCTVCHPHEYELIGCSGQIDSVCASCTTGWLRSTPKTIDFFRKCKRHPQLPFIFPDVPYPVRVKSNPSSMFSDQEKMLQDAENTETAELSEELSEEDTDDYDGEEEEEEEESLDIEAVREEGSEEEDEFEDTGVDPVEVDEREDSDEMVDEELMKEKIPRTMYQFHRELEQMIAEKMEKSRDEEVLSESVEDEDSEEVKEEERPDPFDTKKESVEKDEEEGSEQENEEEKESEEVLTYPLHRANIWRIIGSELGRSDDKDISKETREAISERKKKWQLQKIMQRRRAGVSSSEEIDVTKLRNDYMELKGGYRPLPMKVETPVGIAGFTSVPPLIGALCFALITLCVVFTVKICLMRRRDRVIILPELDEMSRHLINEAHARVHSKKEKKIRPEFV